MYWDIVQKIHPNYTYDKKEFIRNAKEPGTFIDKSITITCPHKTIRKRYSYWVRNVGCELCENL